MKKISLPNIKRLTLIFSIVGVFIFVFGFNVRHAGATACSTTGTGGLWSATTTWAAPCNTAGTIPGANAADTVTVAAGTTLTADVSKTITTLTITAPTGATGTVGTVFTVNSGVTTTVTGTFTPNGPTTTTNTMTVAVNGTLSVGALTYGTGATNRNITITVAATTGALTINGTVTAGSGGTRTLTLNSGSTLNLNNATIPTGLTISSNAASIINSTGTNNINGGYTFGILNVNSGTLRLGGAAIAFSGATDVASGASIVATSATGTKSFNGNVIVDSGGTFDLSSFAVPSQFSGNVTNNSANVLKTGSGTALTSVVVTGMTFGGTGSYQFGSLTTNANISTTFNSPVTLTGNFTMAAATATTTININSTFSVAGTFTMTASSAATNIVLGSSANLTVTGTTTMNQPTGAVTQNLNVGAATATFNGTLMMASTSTTTTRISKVTLTTGTINFNGTPYSINTSGATGGTTAAVHVIDISGGAGTLNLQGQVGTTNSFSASGWTFTNTTCTNGGGTFIYDGIGTAQNINLPGAGGYCNLTVLSGDATMGSADVNTTNIKGNIIIGDDVNTVSFTNIGANIVGNTGKSFILHNLATYKQTQQVAERLPSGFSTITFDTNSTVEFNSTASYTLSSGKTFGNLAFKPTTAGLTFTLPASITINGSFTVGDGTNAVTVSADTNDPTLNIPGAFTVNDGGTFNASHVNSLTVGSTMTIGGGTSGVFTENGGIVDLNGNLVIGAGATFNDSPTSQLQFTKGAAQTITDNTATKQDLGVVVTSVSGTSVTSTTSFTVTDLTIGSGTTFDISSDTLTLTDTSGTLIANSGTFTTTGSTIVVTGSGTKTLATGVSTINNLTISSTGTNNTNILSNLTLNGSLSVGATSSITVNTATFTVAGSVSNAGTLVSSYASGLISVGGNWTNTGTFTAGTSTVKLTSTSSSAITFAGGGSTYNNVWLAHGLGTGSYVITGSNTFNDFKDDGSAAHSILFTAGTTTTVATFTVSGTSGNLITITSGDGAGNLSTLTHTLTKTGGGTISVDYVVVEHSIATPASTWNAGSHSTDNNSTADAGSGWIIAGAVQGAYGGTPWTIPGTIQAEDFDTGGQDVAYNDSDPLLNQAGQYRPSEGVDIEVTQDTTGAYNIGWYYNTEWMEYTVNVVTPGTYTVSARVASNAGSQALTFAVDGVNTATVAVPNTGSFQVWQTATSANFDLTVGQHIIRVSPTGNSTNLNYFTFNLIAAAACTSNATGAWNTAGTWSCGHVPANTDAVVVATGHTVTMDVGSNSLTTVTVNGTLNTSGYALTANAISIASGGTISAGSSTITLTGTSGTLFTNAGTFTPSTSTVVMSGNGDATVNYGTVTFNNLQITGTGTKTLTSATTLNGSLTIGSGATLLAGGYDVTVAGSVTNNGTYSIAGAGAWPYYKVITIDHTKVPNTDQTNFPVLISGTYADLKTIGNGGHVVNANGYDIAFFSDPSLSTQLKWEIENYVPSTGQIVAWVKVPTLSHTSDTLIYIAYGNTSISTDQSDKANVWDSNFKAVWHMDDTVTGTNQTVSNSTSFSENLTTKSSGTYSGALVAGPVGNGLSVKKATNDYLQFPQVTLSGDWTIEGWTKLEAYPDQFSSFFGNGTTGGGLIFNTNWFAFMHRAWNGSSDDVVSDTGVTQGVWTHFVITRSSTAMALYMNGDSHGTSTTGKNAIFQYLGVNADGTSTGNINYDEVRISTAQRSADWVKTEYNNQNSPSTFYAIGTEQTTSSASTTSVGGDWTNSGTFIGGTSTVKMTKTSGTATFAGGNATYPILWLAPGVGTTTFTISGNNTFGELKDDGSSAHTIKFTAGSTQTITTWSVVGTSGNLITLDSTSTGTYNLTKPSGASETRVDYLNIQHAIATPDNSWYAGDNSINNQYVTSSGYGWVFTTRTKHRGGGSVRSAGGETDNGTGSGTCSDQTQNGNETGVDSGGRCANTGGGNGGGGGATGGETDNGTGTGTCSDGIKNGNEVTTDSGGRCGNTGGGSGGGGGDVGFLFFFQQIKLPNLRIQFAFR